MIRVTIELVQYGIEEEKKVIGMAMIWDDRTGSVDYRNYKSEFISNFRNRNFKTSLKRFPQLREDIWDLVNRLLNTKGKQMNNKIDPLKFNYKAQKVNRKKIRKVDEQINTQWLPSASEIEDMERASHGDNNDT